MKKIIHFFKITLLRIRIVLTRYLNSGIYQYQKPNKISVPFCFRKFHITISGKNNEILVPNLFKGKLDIHITGNNNKIYFKGPFKTTLTQIKIQGDNNWVEIGASQDAAYRIDFYPRLASKCNNAKIIIGDNVLTSNQTWLKVGDHNASIEIGDETTISWDVSIWNVDGHAIFPKDDMEKKKPINIGKTLKIGSHCWIGKGASILKNVTLPDYTIVGMGAVVSKKDLIEPYCALAGNPAQIVKRNIQWDIRSPSDFSEVDV